MKFSQSKGHPALLPEPRAGGAKPHHEATLSTAPSLPFALLYSRVWVAGPTRITKSAFKPLLEDGLVFAQNLRTPPCTAPSHY